MSAPCALPSEQTRSIPEHIVKNMLAGVRLDALEQAADLCFNIAKRLRSYPDRSSELQAQGATECGSALMALKNAAGQVPAQTASGVPVSGPAPAAPDDDYDALHPSRYGKKGD